MIIKMFNLKAEKRITPSVNVDGVKVKMFNSLNNY